MSKTSDQIFNKLTGVFMVGDKIILTSGAADLFSVKKGEIIFITPRDSYPYSVRTDSGIVIPFRHNELMLEG